jgi:hypothetical protein
MNKQSLTLPFEPSQIRQRPGQHGKTLSYVDVAAVIARLNEAFDHDWSFEIASHEIHDGEVIVLGKLCAGGVTKMAFGGSAVTIDRQGQIVSIADDLKSAASDSTKKCASLLGVGLELYGGNYKPAERAKVLQPVKDRVTTRQLAAIHGASRRLGLSKDRLADVLMKTAGKIDIAQLSKSEASSIISELTGTNGGGR